MTDCNCLRTCRAELLAEHGSGLHPLPRCSGVHRPGSHRPSHDSPRTVFRRPQTKAPENVDRSNSVHNRARARGCRSLLRGQLDHVRGSQLCFRVRTIAALQNQSGVFEARRIRAFDETWRLVRYARISGTRRLELGLMSQSRSGGGNNICFQNLQLNLDVVAEIRGGSYYLLQ